MNDTLVARLAEVESRVSFQEYSLIQLSDALAEMRAENTRLLLTLQRALDELRQVRLGLATDLTGDPALEPPPPHY